MEGATPSLTGVFRKYPICLLLLVANAFILFLISEMADYGTTHFTSVSSLLSSTREPSKNSSSSSSSLSTSGKDDEKDVKRQLLLVTQGRSGSSFTGSIIGSNSRVSYSFEPLHGMHLTDKAQPETDPPISRDERQIGLLRAFLKCDFAGVWPFDLNTNFIKRTGPVERYFINCVRLKNQSGFVHIKCLLDLIKHCRSQEVTFVKTIRIYLKQAERLLVEMPKLKILYLIRDPRAVLHSQAKVFRNFKWEKNVTEKVISFCDRLRQDAETIIRLKQLFPGRLKVFRYEDGAIDPYQYARDLYAFSGLKFTNVTFKYIYDIQRPRGKEINSSYSLKRDHPSYIINKWRLSNGSYEVAKIVDRFCAKIYLKFGYLPVGSQDDLKSNRSLYSKSMALDML